MFDADIYVCICIVIQGMLDSPKGVGKAVGKSAVSLIRNTTVGVVDSAGKVFGSLSKGVRMLEVDADGKGRQRQRKREQRRRAAQKRGVGRGTLEGLRAFGASVADGVSGVVLDPVRAAKTGGAKGFFKGLGGGLLGVVLKPTAGLLDMTTLALNDISSTTKVRGLYTILIALTGKTGTVRS